MNPLSHSVVLRDGAFESEDDGRAVADLLSRAAASTNGRKLLVHFHGGLVDRASGARQAEVVGQAASDAGAFPVGVVWQSGLHDVFNAKLPALRHEPLFARVLFRVLQFTSNLLVRERPRAGAMSIRSDLSDPAIVQREIEKSHPFSHAEFETVRPPSATLPEEERSRLEELLASDQALMEDVNAIQQRRRGRISRRSSRAMAAGTGRVRSTLVDDEVLDDIRREEPAPARPMGLVSGAVLLRAFRVASAMVSRFYTGRDHGFHLTAVEEVLRAFYAAAAGQVVWSRMKQSISNAFTSANHGGSTLVDALVNAWNGGYRPERIILTAHSAGSYYACHLMKHLATRLPPQVGFDLIFIAPACDFVTLAETAQMLGPRIKEFRLFGMSDALELDEPLISAAPVVFPASLLYFVSGVLEPEPDTPLVGMQRFHTGREPYTGYPFDAVTELAQHRTAWSQRKPGGVVFKVQAGQPGASCGMMQHGGFTEEPMTMDSIRHLVRSGF